MAPARADRTYKAPIRNPTTPYDAQQENKWTRQGIMILQRRIAILAVSSMAIGCIIVSLGILARRIVRLIYVPWDHEKITLTSDASILSGLFHIVHAGYCCFAAIWELETPIRAGLVSCITVLCVDFFAVLLLSLSLTRKQFPRTIFRAWYVWECSESGSCAAAYSSYCVKYLFPQTLLILLLMVLQFSYMYYLGHYATTLRIRQLRIWRGVPDLRENQDVEESQL